MKTVPETAKAERIRECMERLAARANVAKSRMTFDYSYEEMRERKHLLHEWFAVRMAYLQEEYRTAINEADNIIGKQWLFDQRPKLQDRYYQPGERDAYDKR